MSDEAPKYTITVPRIRSRSTYERCKVGAMLLASQQRITRESDFEDTYDG
jgi:hypothetical protein